MDTIIEKKKGIKLKHVVIAVVSGGLLFFVGYLAFGDTGSNFNVDKDSVTISEVINDKFIDYISISGLVNPISTVYMDAYEGGRVMEILIEEGNMVNKGDVILKLENRELYGQILNSETSLAAKQNDLRETQINFESRRIAGQRSLLEMEYQLKKAKRKYLQDESLFNDELIAKEVYLQSKENYELAQKSYEVNKFQTKQDSLLNTTSILDLRRDLERMKKTLGMEYERIENLNVKATANGQLGTLNAEIGKQIGRGQNIGQINVLTDFKIESTIDEHYIDRVKRGLTGTFERDNNVYQVAIKKVYPDVKEGKFKIDMVFSEDKPENIRTGQSYYIKLQLGAPTEALLLPRGAFFQSTGGQWVYVVDSSGTNASKRQVKIGKQNPKFYEVIEGLQQGEMVVTSSYDNFGDSDKLILK
ncbi:efflux RND transporter periplasmic adaptor subunit [Aestuariibaculum sediminum]|uniref:HlyD family efflux transporter periplasmic adaptor subunit n=1 Tax=Aestuariibaculum sediminum TaxID=2770637 RepID=A0A8J6Q3J5_9FLAO|nr:HlyD family efflux transporter periplasmic adaptor subunit [Aestuariibaculum sediminum]MBD0833771.1 HlyD family efflux transporter periplasmic adaptor subunit [Aestuariibaculum sediminum]